MTTILIMINGKSVSTNVETAELSSAQKKELKALGIDGDVLIRFGSGSVQAYSRSEFEKAVRAAQALNELASSVTWS